MKSLIYSCLLAVVGPFLVTAALAAMVIVDDQGNREALIDLITGALLGYCYAAGAISLLYGILVKTQQLKGKWWMNLILFVVVTVVLPLLFVVPSLRGVDLANSGSGGASLIGQHLFYIFVASFAVLVWGILAKRGPLRSTIK